MDDCLLNRHRKYVLKEAELTTLIISLLLVKFRQKCFQHAEKMRVRALRAIAAREEAEIERDRALELTLEVLRRKRADKRRGISRAHSAPGVPQKKGVCLVDLGLYCSHSHK